MIEVAVKSVKKILTDDDIFYQIPDYQRPYSWDKENISELVDDVTNSFLNNKEEDYFCGSIVLVKSNNYRFDVIDGQQRLTTFIIMSCVFREIFSEQLNLKAKDLILASIQDKYDKEKRKLKFLTNEQYQIDFEQTVLEKIEFTEIKNIEKEIIDNNYLKNAYYFRIFLTEKFNEKNINANEFIIWFFEKVVLTIITTDNQDNAIKIFNVLNDRGLPLSPIDILKSSLMTKLTEEDRKAFKNKWDMVASTLKGNELEFEDLLNTYLYFKIATNPANRLDKELIAYFEKENINPLKIIFEIENFSKSFLEIINNDDRYIYMLKYLQHKIYWYAIIATANFIKYPDFEKLKEFLVAYYYQNWIAGATIARIKQTSFNILKALKDRKDIEYIKKLMKENLTYYDTRTVYKSELESNNIYGRKWDKPLLLLLEYFSTDTSKLNFIPINNQLQIEHILPKSQNNENAEWFNLFTKKETEELTNCLGNLTLLSMRKNIQASNNSFINKKDIYKNKDNMITGFIITQDLLNYNEWKKEQIIKRREHLIKKINDKLDILH